MMLCAHGTNVDRPNENRQAFTLVELMVSITIIVILATTVLYGMAGVQNTAKAARTKSQIARIHELIAEKWESYETRRISYQFPNNPFTGNSWLADLRHRNNGNHSNWFGWLPCVSWSSWNCLTVSPMCGNGGSSQPPNRNIANFQRHSSACIESHITFHRRTRMAMESSRRSRKIPVTLNGHSGTRVPNVYT